MTTFAIRIEQYADDDSTAHVFTIMPDGCKRTFAAGDKDAMASLARDMQKLNRKTVQAIAERDYLTLRTARNL